MAGEATTQRECPRCGTQLPAFAAECHGCSLRLDPGVAYFESSAAPDAGESIAASPDARQSDAAGATGRDRAPSTQETAASPETIYDHRTVTCLPMDLERVARAEAVDGWALLDTTVDPDRPGSIVAHFRRPARSEGGATAGQAAAGAATPEREPARDGRAEGVGDAETAPGDRAEGAGRTAKAGKARPAPTPASSPKKKKEDWQYLLYVGLLVLGVLVLLRLMGPIGLLVALFLLPGIIRSALGMPSRKRRKRRRRRR